MHLCIIWAKGSMRVMLMALNYLKLVWYQSNFHRIKVFMLFLKTRIYFSFGFSNGMITGQEQFNFHGDYYFHQHRFCTRKLGHQIQLFTVNNFPHKVIMTITQHDMEACVDLQLICSYKTCKTVGYREETRAVSRSKTLFQGFPRGIYMGFSITTVFQFTFCTINNFK